MDDVIVKLDVAGRAPQSRRPPPRSDWPASCGARPQQTTWMVTGVTGG